MPQRKRNSEVHVDFTHGHLRQIESEENAKRVPPLLEKTILAIKKLKNPAKVSNVTYSDAGGKNSVIVTLLKSRKAK